MVKRRTPQTPATSSLQVMDADTLTRNDLIGSYTVDASYVYFKKDHEQVDDRRRLP